MSLCRKDLSVNFLSLSLGHCGSTEPILTPACVGPAVFETDSSRLKGPNGFTPFGQNYFTAVFFQENEAFHSATFNTTTIIYFCE